MIVAFESAEAAAAFVYRHELGRHVISPIVFDTGCPADPASRTPLAGAGLAAGAGPAWGGRRPVAVPGPPRVGECPVAGGATGPAGPDRRGRPVAAPPSGPAGPAQGDTQHADVAAGERARLLAEYRRAIIALLALEPVPLTGLHGGGVTPGEARAYELGQLRHAQAVLAELARAWSPVPDRGQRIAQ
ncbi:hypothetical protein [Pseudofrankia sp. DC12]|uniref:hypothetical protein n=1 Tax=Pseudofrankia sp. DC12 TaxID=683315 RepID=UPI0005F849FF|nr:hypothetical protein [Pseudofrankia sp. DC12]